MPPPGRIPSWTSRLARELRRIGGGYGKANCDSVQRAVLGQDPFGDGRSHRSGARIVFNLPAAHVPAFCSAATRGDPRPYKNAYDLARLKHGKPVSAQRLAVDAALMPPPAMEDVCFGAVELNGAGIRFYGDVCLVLRPEAVAADTALLDRNSFELLRAPIAGQVARSRDAAAARRRIVQGWRGEWLRDLAAMATLKVLGVLGLRERRWTTGQISQALRDDEDYLEALRRGSFGPADVQEARVATGDAALDALIGSRLEKGPLPRLEARLWRIRRRRAERALREHGVPVHVVTTAGRARV